MAVTFTPKKGGSTVRLENSGFDIFAEGAPERIDRVGGGWLGITRHYRDAL